MLSILIHSRDQNFFPSHESSL